MHVLRWNSVLVILHTLTFSQRYLKYLGYIPKPSLIIYPKFKLGPLNPTTLQKVTF